MRDEGVPGTSYIIVDSLRHGTIPWYDEFGRIFFRSQQSRLEYVTADGRAHVVELSADPRSRNDVFWDAVRAIKADFPDDISEQLATLARAHGMDAYEPEVEPQMMAPDQAREIIAGRRDVVLVAGAEGERTKRQ